jgi:hypothetical protein
MHNISLKGIILAIMLVVALDTISGIAIMPIFFGGDALDAEMTEQERNDAITAVTLTTNFLLTSLIRGVLSIMVGGYVAVRIAKKEPYLNAGAFGAAGIILKVLFLKTLPLWFNVSSLLLVLPAALLGGQLAKSRIVGNAGQVTTAGAAPPGPPGP